jgi:hypothetical protein
MAALGGFAVDPRIAEANSIMGRSLERVNEAYMGVMEGYYGDKHFTFFPGTPGVDETVEIVPERDYKFKANVVSYAFPGSDASQVSVAITQLVGSKIMSRATGRQKHPFIDDAQQEENNVDEEALTDAFETGLQQQLASGQGVQLPTIARTIQLLRSGRDLVDAYMQATAEDQAAQQAQGSGMPGAGAPGQPPPVSGQPGAAPGPGGQLPPQLAAALQQMGAQGQGGSPGPPVPPPSPSLLNTRHMAQALNAQVSPGAV